MKPSQKNMKPGNLSSGWKTKQNNFKPSANSDNHDFKNVPCEFLDHQQHYGAIFYMSPHLVCSCAHAQGCTCTQYTFLSMFTQYFTDLQGAVMHQEMQSCACQQVNTDENNAGFTSVGPSGCTQCVLVSNTESQQKLCLQENSTGHL